MYLSFFHYSKMVMSCPLWLPSPCTKGTTEATKKNKKLLTFHWILVFFLGILIMIVLGIPIKTKAGSIAFRPQPNQKKKPGVNCNHSIPGSCFFSPKKTTKWWGFQLVFPSSEAIGHFNDWHLQILRIQRFIKGRLNDPLWRETWTPLRLGFGGNRIRLGWSY